jgi:hypothetical protein
MSDELDEGGLIVDDQDAGAIGSAHVTGGLGGVRLLWLRDQKTGKGCIRYRVGKVAAPRLVIWFEGVSRTLLVRLFWENAPKGLAVREELQRFREYPVFPCAKASNE